MEPVSPGAVGIRSSLSLCGQAFRCAVPVRGGKDEEDEENDEEGKPAEEDKAGEGGGGGGVCLIASLVSGRGAVHNSEPQRDCDGDWRVVVVVPYNLTKMRKRMTDEDRQTP
ncbi:hypothetical protein O3P69_017975 [Scylla paramamosain]|uniref:Uncharacterized protein n=1 Tax=Scylla paramamosain TaxID=85552 RepID=A0AAW0TI78_SCYPA